VERAKAIGIVCTSAYSDANCVAFSNSFTYRNSLSEPNAIAHSNSDPKSHSVAIYLTNSNSSPFAYLIANAGRYCYTNANANANANANDNDNTNSHGFSHCYSDCHPHSERDGDSRPLGITYSNTFTGSYGNCNPTTECNAEPDTSNARSNAIRYCVSISICNGYSNCITRRNTDCKPDSFADPPAR